MCSEAKSQINMLLQSLLFFLSYFPSLSCSGQFWIICILLKIFFMKFTLLQTRMESCVLVSDRNRIYKELQDRLKITCTIWIFVFLIASLNPHSFTRKSAIYQVLFFCSVVTDDKRVLKQIMIDILNLRNGMEDNLLLIQQINLMIQKEGEELKGFNDVIHAAQQHIESINSVYTLGLSWLTGHTDSFIFGKILFNNNKRQG